MKKLSKLLALLLALTMVFSLVACDSDKGKEDASDEELLVGEWEYRFDMSDLVNEMMGASMGVDSVIPETAIYMELNFNFKSNGKFVMEMAVDEDSLEDYMSDFVDLVVDYMYDYAAEQGMTKSDLDAAIEAEYGMSVRKYMESALEESMDESIADMNETFNAYYKVDEKEGRIYVAEDEDDLDDSEDYFEYTVTESKLTIKDMVGEDFDVSELEDIGMDLPWKFEKK